MQEFRTIIEPFRIKMVEPVKVTTKAEREQFLKEAHYNPFLIDSEQVLIDFLTDSGTSAMSSEQWSGIMRGDESYAGAKSWIRMRDEIRDLTGFTFIFPTHQGRAGERILYSTIGGPGKTFISNTHFDTTRANIEYSGSEAIDIPCTESNDLFSEEPFKGNMDTIKLQQLIAEKGKENVAAVILTVTNNSGGGQPVSMSNAREVSRICRGNNVLLILDCCRVAENAWFIKQDEKGFAERSCRSIATEMFGLCDGAVMSAKKDALVNMGGFLTLNNEELANRCKTMLIITEGFATYGGLSGRDMEAIAQGLKEVFDEDYLEYRIKSTRYLGRKLREMGVPVVWPTGGHAVYIDAKGFYPDIPSHQFPGQAMVCELYKTGGIRAVEIGSLMFGKYDKEGNPVSARLELVRLAIPRRVYTQSHIEYVIEVFEKLLEGRENVTGYKITEEPAFLRHFTCKLKPLAKNPVSA